MYTCTHVYKFVYRQIYMYIYVYIHKHTFRFIHVLWSALGHDAFREVGGWGRVPFSKKLMRPTPRRKWYLTTGRRAH